MVMTSFRAIVLANIWIIGVDLFKTQVFVNRNKDEA